MAILIENMEMPKEGEWISVNIFHDGKCFLQSWCGKDFNFAAKLTAVPVPPHGRLIDADALDTEIFQAGFSYALTRRKLRYTPGDVRQKIANAPTVIEAEEDE